jgi:hypothetical protein
MCFRVPYRTLQYPTVPTIRENVLLGRPRCSNHDAHPDLEVLGTRRVIWHADGHQPCQAQHFELADRCGQCWRGRRLHAKLCFLAARIDLEKHRQGRPAQSRQRRVELGGQLPGGGGGGSPNRGTLTDLALPSAVDPDPRGQTESAAG